MEPFKPDEASHWSAPRRSGRAIHLAVDIAAMLCKFVGRCLRGGSFIPREQTLIEDPETAKYVSNLFLSINDQMDESIRAVENRVSTEEYKWHTVCSDMVSKGTVLELTVCDLHFRPLNFSCASCYRRSCTTKENSSFKSQLTSGPPAIQFDRLARSQRNTRGKPRTSPLPLPPEPSLSSATVRLSRFTRHEPRVTDF